MKMSYYTSYINTYIRSTLLKMLAVFCRSVEVKTNVRALVCIHLLET